MYHGSNDPWYTVNGTEHEDRFSYYNVTAIPTLWVGGELDIWPINDASIGNAVDDRMENESPVSIQIITIPLEDEMQVMAIVENSDADILEDHRIRFALVSNDVFWNGASNGQTDFYHDCVDLAPDADGLEFTIDANATEIFETSFNWPITLNNDVLTEEEVTALVWVQNDDTKDVLQSEMAAIGGGFDFYSVSDVTNHLVPAGTMTDFSLEIGNSGLLEDTYDITVVSDIPPGWSYEYTTPDGETTGDYALTLLPEENYISTISVTTDAASPAEDGMISFTVTSQSVPVFTNTYNYYVHASGQILVINGESEGNFESFYNDALLAAEETVLAGDLNFSFWNKAENVLVPAEILDATPELIIWYTGATGTISPQECTVLDEFLAGGGNLWITGSQAPFYLDGSALITSMGAEYQEQFEQGISVFGVEDDPYYGGLEFDIQGGDGADNRGIPSSLRDDGGTDCLKYSTIRRAGIRHEGEGYRTLLLGFPFEAIADVDSRNEVMLNSLGWLIEYDYDSVDELSAGSIPSTYSLEQNYPNPFNPETEIEFSLPVHAQVTLAVYDLMGREVAVLADAQFEAGKHTVSWNASDMSSGVYFYSIKTAGENSGFSSTRKMMLLK